MREAGLCECGCGEATRLAPQTMTSRGWVKGQPLRFVHGHAWRGRVRMAADRQQMSERARGERNAAWKADGVSYKGLHLWVAANKEKSGVCDDCGATVGTAKGTGTEWANVSGEYQRDLDDFRELCVPCHRASDNARRMAA